MPNQRNEALHQKLGYIKVGVMERCGVKFDQVIDTFIWQRSLIEEHG
ncbi:GNAT family N-acetyltransferase [Endozoicomonas sp. SESOKO1]|nr:hypothetical protein [Endozoicomonas sp. SESOKO1]